MAQEMTVSIEDVDEALHTAPVIQFDGAMGIAGTHQWIKFNLFQDKLVGSVSAGPAGPIKRVVCARLVMTPETFFSLTKWMSDHAAQFESLKKK